MENERSRLIDLPQNLPISFHLSLVFLSFFIFISYVIFSYRVDRFDMGLEAIFSWERLDEFIEDPSAIWNFISNIGEFWELIIAISMSMLIPYQLLTIKSINENVKLSFRRIAFQQDNNEMGDTDFYSRFKEMVIQPKRFYILLFLVNFPFILVYASIYEFYSAKGYTIAATLFDIYNLILYFLVVFLFSVIIWIILAISKSLKMLTYKPCKDLIVFTTINYDKMGGLSHLRDLVFKVILLYSSCISLAVFLYYRPYINISIKQINFMFSYEIFILIALFIIGTISLLHGLGKIKYLINYRKSLAFDNIEKIYRIQLKKLETSIDKNEEKSKNDELRATDVISILNTERSYISAINSRMYDFSKIASLISSIALPIISKLIQDALLHNNNILSSILNR